MMDGLVTTRDGAVAIVRLARPPHNFFDAALLAGLADVLTANDADPSVRVTLLTAEGRSFCAGADFSRAAAGIEGARAVYVQAARLFARAKPLVAAVGGPAVGGGLGLALVADFRVVSSAARFHANFAAIGLHPGFAITATLPALVGAQRARDLLTTARRVGGEEAATIGLADRLAPAEALDEVALALARDIAANAPLALAAIARALPRIDAATAAAAMAAELDEQAALFATADFHEGVRATSERRPPVFEGR
jgi:2-(1,2-epoxy-1,2-dihydrophenyl)acetyl-CoA isomerase